jgi:hypothetical protein
VVVRLLLEKGAEIDERMGVGETALQVAVGDGHEAAVQQQQFFLAPQPEVPRTLPSILEEDNHVLAFPTWPAFKKMAETLEPLPTRSPPPTFGRPTIEEDGGRKDRHNNAKTSSGLGFWEIPIPIDLACEETKTESELGSAQHPILIEDRDVLPQLLPPRIKFLS